MNHPSPFSRASLQLNVADLVVLFPTTTHSKFLWFHHIRKASEPTSHHVGCSRDI
ncbi:hypothetical protein LINPERHAP1_LOCUS10520 [Linum perenne]